MRFVFGFLLVAVGGFLTHPAAASVTAVSTEARADQAGEKLRVATELIEIMAPSDLSLQANVRSWESATRAVLGRDAGVTKLNTDYPGTINAAVEAARPLAAQ